MPAGHGGGIFDGSYNHPKINLGDYLYMGNVFWTMTPVGGYIPYGISSWTAYVFCVSRSFDDHGVYDADGIRPIINIRSDVTITGTGTKTDPYVINE